MSHKNKLWDCTSVAVSAAACNFFQFYSTLFFCRFRLNMAQHAYINNLLSDELLLNVFTRLGIKDLMRIAKTCQKWHRLSNDHMLWKRKCQEEEITEIKENLSWKEEYINHYAIDQNWRKKTDFSRSVIIQTHKYDFLLLYGDILITTGDEKSDFHMWSVETGKMVRTFIGHRDFVRKVEIVNDNIISCSYDATLRIWNKETGKCLHVLTGHSHFIGTFDINGNKLITGSMDKTLRIWDLTHKKCLHILHGHEDGIKLVTSKGNFVISGGGLWDRSIKLWELETGQCLHTYAGDMYIMNLGIVDHCVVLSALNYVTVWDIDKRKVIQKLLYPYHPRQVRSFLSRFFLPSTSNNCIKIISVPSMKCSQTLSGCNEAIARVMDVAVTKNYFITLHFNSRLNLWEKKSGKFVRNLNPAIPNEEIRTMKHENNKLLLETRKKIYILDFN